MTKLVFKYKNRLLLLTALSYFDILYSITQGVWQAPFWGEFRWHYFMNSVSGNVFIVLMTLITYQLMLFLKLRSEIVKVK